MSDGKALEYVQSAISETTRASEEHGSVSLDDVQRALLEARAALARARNLLLEARAARGRAA